MTSPLPSPCALYTTGILQKCCWNNTKGPRGISSAAAEEPPRRAWAFQHATLHAARVHIRVQLNKISNNCYIEERSVPLESSLNRHKALSSVTPCILHLVSVIMLQVNRACVPTAITPCQPRAGLLWMASGTLRCFSGPFSSTHHA